MLGGAVTHHKDRWLQPRLFFAPVKFFACARQLHGDRRLRPLQRLVVSWALLLVLMSLRVPVAGSSDTPWPADGPAVWIGKGEEPEALADIAHHARQPAVAPTTIVLPPRHALASAAPLHLQPAAVSVTRAKRRLPTCTT